MLAGGEEVGRRNERLRGEREKWPGLSAVGWNPLAEKCARKLAGWCGGREEQEESRAEQREAERRRDSEGRRRLKFESARSELASSSPAARPSRRLKRAT